MALGLAICLLLMLPLYSPVLPPRRLYSLPQLTTAISSPKSRVYIIYIYFIYNPNLGLEITVFN